MTRINHTPANAPEGRFAVVQAAYEVTLQTQNRRAARIVAGHASDVQDCAELLAMLGLEVGAEHSAKAQPS